MTNRPRSACATFFKLTPLFAAIAGQLLLASGATAAPAGGVVVGGTGTIEQTGLDTTITQNSDRLAVDWASFNIAADERVAFVQPDQNAIALNRILDASGSRILGRIDANGQVILMNPNGVFFGEGASVNVGGLVASGLAIDTSDFLNGDLLLTALDGTAGTVINRGLINAATGGNVALIGKQVTNTGVISANLGHVALAAGRHAVVTFDDQGLLGIRVDEASLQAELGMGPGVTNSGTIGAAGGKILLTGSVSEDLFARAVNAGNLSGGTQAVIHDDGSFTLGAGVDVLNTGTLSTSTDTGIAGDIIAVGRNVNQRGLVEADHTAGGEAGGIHLEADNAVRLTHGATLRTQGAATSGAVVLKADQVLGNSDTSIHTTGDTTLTAHLQLKAPTLSSQNLTVKSVGTVRQTGALAVADTAHFVLTADADVRLDNNANDFHRVTMDTGHTSLVSLRDANDLELGTLDLLDSTVRLTAQGTIRQAEGTAVLLDGSELHLTAAQIELGQQSEASGISLYNGWLDLQFSEAIHALDAVRTPGTFNNSLITARGSNGVDLLVARSQGDFALAATLDPEFSGINLGGLTAATASLTTIGNIQQTGAIRLSGALNINMGAGGSALLKHRDNDIRSVNLDLGHTSVVELTDANDLLIGNLNILDSRVVLTSLGSNAMISQLAMSHIDLYDSTLEVNAARIYLGDKANTQLRLHSFSDLYANYTRGARIFGTSTSPAELPEFVPFFSRGDSGATRLEAQGRGNFALNVSANDVQFNIHQLAATDAHLTSIGRVRQSGAITLSGELSLNLISEADIKLEHSANDFAKVSATTAYTSNVDLYDANDLILGNLDLADSNVRIRTGGDLLQDSDGAITLADSALRLTGASITLGKLAEDSGAKLFNSLLELEFSDAIDVVDALQTGGEFDFSTIVVNGQNTEVTANELQLEQSTPLHARVNLNGHNGELLIDFLDAENAELFTFNRIVQSGKMRVSGELLLRTPVGGEVLLDHPENDVARLAIESGHASAIDVTNANDLLLGNWDMTDTTVTLRSLSVDGTVRQADDTHLQGGDSDLTIHAANIDLGAQGTASISFGGIGLLYNYFRESLTINGKIDLGGTYSYLGAEGTDGDNRLTIGEFADVDISSTFENYLIDLKGGNDVIEIHRDFPYGFYTGSGQNQIYLVNQEVNYTVEDFDPLKDEILLLP